MCLRGVVLPGPVRRPGLLLRRASALGAPAASASDGGRNSGTTLRHGRRARPRQRGPHRRAGAGPVGGRRARARRRRRVRRAPPGGGGRPRPARLGRVPRGRRRSPASPAPASTCCDVGVLPTPAVAFLTADLGADLGVMLSATHNADARQRHQVLRPRRPQARRRRSRTPSRRYAHRREQPGTARPAPPSAGSAPYAEGFEQLRRPPAARCCRTASTACKVVLDGAHGAAARVSPEAFAPGRRRGDHASAPSPTASTSTTARLDPPRTTCARRASSTAPTSASPTTATPTAASRWTPTGDEVDGDQILAVLALRDAGGRARWPKNTVVGDGDVQPGLQAGDGARGHRRWCRPRSATATCWRR